MFSNFNAFYGGCFSLYVSDWALFKAVRLMLHKVIFNDNLQYTATKFRIQLSCVTPSDYKTFSRALFYLRMNVR